MSEETTRASSGLDEIRSLRIAAAENYRKLNIDPYPTAPVSKTMARDAAALPVGSSVRIAGRIMLLRPMGNLTFGQLHDESGDVQFMLSKRDFDAAQPEGTEQGFKFWSKRLDVGDIIAIEGERIDTKVGEPTVQARNVTLLTKSLLPLPDKHHGLADEDVLLRKRYLDIMLNRETQDLIYKRSKFWNAIRHFLMERGFIEVQTPVLEHTTGGADARPFITHHNFLDVDVSLRISVGELWQKRLLVGGLEKVFEIGRQFRNESQSREHANDYEQMEFYWAYANYQWGMELVEELHRYVAMETWGTTKFTLHRNNTVYEIDLAQPWERYEYVETVRSIAGIDVLTATTDEIRSRLHELKVNYDPKGFNHPRAIDSLWKHCRRQLQGPGFLIDVPVAISPLAKRKPDNPLLTERFQVIIAGSELGNGYSELNDPIDQANRFAEQQALRDAGDDEAQMADHEFVEALEYGMPPACGFGMSERTFSFFMDKSLRESQIFPLLRPLAPS